MQSPNSTINKNFEKYRDKSMEKQQNNQQIFNKQFTEYESDSNNLTVIKNNSPIKNQQAFFEQQEEIEYWRNKFEEIKRQNLKQEEEINYLNSLVQKYKRNLVENSNFNNEKINNINNNVKSSTKVKDNNFQIKEIEQKDYLIRSLKAQCDDYFKTIKDLQEIMGSEKKGLKDEMDLLQQTKEQNMMKRLNYLQKLQQLINPLVPQYNIKKIEIDQTNLLLEDLQNRVFNQVKLLVDHKCINNNNNNINNSNNSNINESHRQEELIEIRNGYEKKCLEYSRFIQKQLNTLYKNYENSKQVQKSIQDIQFTLNQQLQHCDQTQQMITNLNKSQDQILQLQSQLSQDQLQQIQSQLQQQQFKQSQQQQQSQNNLINNHFSIQDVQNNQQFNNQLQVKDKNKIVIESKLINQRELNVINFPIKGILLLNIVFLNLFKEFGPVYSIVKVNQLEKRSKKSQGDNENELFRFDILIKNKQELPKVIIDVVQNVDNIGKIVLNDSEISDVISKESVWFNLQRKIEGEEKEVIGVIEINMMFINNECVCGFSQGILDPYFDSVRNNYFPLKNVELILQIQQILEMQMSFNEKQMLYIKIIVGKQVQTTSKAQCKTLEWNMMNQFNVDILQNSIPQLDIEVYESQDDNLLGKVSNFPISTLLNRPCQWLFYKQELLDPSNQTIIATVLFKMMLIVQKNYTDYQLANFKQFSNVKQSKKSNANIQFNLDNISQTSSNTNQNIKKQQLAQSKYNNLEYNNNENNSMDVSITHQNPVFINNNNNKEQKNKLDVKKSVHFRQSLANFIQEDKYKIRGKLFVVIESGENLKETEDSNMFYIQITLNENSDKQYDSNYQTQRSENKEGPNPIWNQQFTFNFQAQNQDTIPTLTFELFNFNRAYNDSFLGAIKNIDILEAVHNPNETLSAQENFSNSIASITFDIIFIPSNL